MADNIAKTKEHIYLDTGRTMLTDAINLIGHSFLLLSNKRRQSLRNYIIAFQISLLHLGAHTKFTFSDLRYCLPILDIASLSDFIVNAALTVLANPEVILGAVFSSVLSWGILHT
jgi:hypothetical protein